MKILEKILSNKINREALIKEFQNYVWNNLKYSDNEKINEILSELAYDLDFYEPDKERRKEDSMYYGERRLKREIQSTLEKIEKYNN